MITYQHLAAIGLHSSAIMSDGNAFYIVNTDATRQKRYLYVADWMQTVAPAYNNVVPFELLRQSGERVVKSDMRRHENMPVFPSNVLDASFTPDGTQYKPSGALNFQVVPWRRQNNSPGSYIENSNSIITSIGTLFSAMRATDNVDASRCLLYQIFMSQNCQDPVVPLLPVRSDEVVQNRQAKSSQISRTDLSPWYIANLQDGRFYIESKIVRGLIDMGVTFMGLYLQSLTADAPDEHQPYIADRAPETKNLVHNKYVPTFLAIGTTETGTLWFYMQPINGPTETRDLSPDGRQLALPSWQLLNNYMIGEGADIYMREDMVAILSKLNPFVGNVLPRTSTYSGARLQNAKNNSLYLLDYGRLLELIHETIVPGSSVIKIRDVLTVNGMLILSHMTWRGMPVDEIVARLFAIYQYHILQDQLIPAVFTNSIPALARATSKNEYNYTSAIQSLTDIAMQLDAYLAETGAEAPYSYITMESSEIVPLREYIYRILYQYQVAPSISQPNPF